VCRPYDSSASVMVLTAAVEAQGQGLRVTDGQRILQAMSDVFLGTTRKDGRDYYVRQFHDMKGTIDTLLTMAREVRQNPLALEQLETDDAFLKMGIQVITSTSDPERVHELLGAEVVGLRTRHTTSIKFFSDMAGYSPTFGILGTVIGLIGVLGQLTEPGKLGPAIASAFAATLWGVLLANAVWLPISNRLRRLSDEEITYREMVIEGLLTMQLNVSSMDLKDRLYAFLPPSERSEEAVAPVTPLMDAEAAA